MRIRAIKTSPVLPEGASLEDILDEFVPSLPDRSVLAVTSKVVAICEGRTVPIAGHDKQELVRREADYYLPPDANPYNFATTITKGFLVGSAGIDESNANGHYVLWPADPQASANRIRRHLANRGSQIGVILTDARTTPLRRGVLGIAIGYSGFQPLRDYRGRTDIFGRTINYSCANIADGLAAAAVVSMGEGDEQTPLAIIDDVGFVDFVANDPSPEELAEISVRLEEDVYAEAFMRLPWQKRPSRP